MKNSTKGTICTFIAIALVYLAAYLVNQPPVWYVVGSFFSVGVVAIGFFVAAALYYTDNDENCW